MRCLQHVEVVHGVVVGVRLQEVETQARVIPPPREAQPRSTHGDQPGVVPPHLGGGIANPSRQHVERHRGRPRRRIQLGHEPVGLVQQIPGEHSAAKLGVRAAGAVAPRQRPDDGVEHARLPFRLGQPRAVTAHARASCVGGVERQGVIEEHEHQLHAGVERQHAQRVKIVERVVGEAGRQAARVDGNAAARVREQEPAHHLHSRRGHGVQVAGHLDVGRGDAVA